MPPDEPSSSPEVERSTLTAFETVLVAGGFVIFAALLFELRTFLSPPLLGGAAVLLLWPLREHRVVRALFTAGGFLIILWFLDRLSGILVPFAVVYLLAYLLDPLVRSFNDRFGISRWVSSLLVTLLTVGLFCLVVVLLVPSILEQIRSMGTRIIASVSGIQQWLINSPLLDQLEMNGLIDKTELIDQISEGVQHQATVLTERLPDAAQGVLSSLGSIITVITIITIMPVILFYTLKDYPHLHPRIVEIFPTWGGRRDYLVRAGSIIGNYLRGQLIISLIGAVVLTTTFIILDVPFGLLLGLLGGLLNMIPNLGAVITNIIGILIALIFGEPWYIDTIKIVGTFLSYSLIEQSLLTPNILSYHVGLHPVLILLSLFVFGYFLGLFGLLIAVPATALIMTVYKAYRDNWNVDLLGRDRTVVTIASRLRQWRDEQKRNRLEDDGGS